MSGMLCLCRLSRLVSFIFYFLLFYDLLFYYHFNRTLCSSSHAPLPSPTQDMYREVIRAAVKEVDDGVAWSRSGEWRRWAARVRECSLCFSLFLLQSLFPILSTSSPFLPPLVGVEKFDVPKEIYGQFYSSDSYIILYTYGTSSTKSYIIYFWQGKGGNV